jgi:hypothetical protein
MVGVSAGGRVLVLGAEQKEWVESHGLSVVGYSVDMAGGLLG